MKVIALGKSTIGILTKQGDQNTIHDFYYVEGLKHNLMSTRKLLQKGYIVYMEDNHCVIHTSKKPTDRKAPITSNWLFPLRIRPDVKGKENFGASFK